MSVVERLKLKRRSSSATDMQILATIWNSQQPLALESPEFDQYASHFCYQLQWRNTLYGSGQQLSAMNPGMMGIVKDIHHGMSRNEIKHRLSLMSSEPETPGSRVSTDGGYIEDTRCQPKALDAVIDFAAQLVSMTYFGDLPHCVSDRTRISWNEGSLQSCLHKHFIPSQDTSIGKLEQTFNACNLERIAGIKIEWTDNLADHLRFVEDGNSHVEKRVAIFHYASFLKFQQSDLFPKGFVDETLRTLALLFPQSNRDVGKWFWSFAKARNLDRQVLCCGRLGPHERRIEKFDIYRERLSILKEAFDESRPESLSQVWYDRRDGVRWYTFWVAMMVLALGIVFGLVQAIQSGFQVYKAYHPSAP